MVISLATFNSILVNIFFAFVAFALYQYSRSIGIDIASDATIRTRKDASNQPSPNVPKHDSPVDIGKRTIYESCEEESTKCYFIEDEVYYDNENENQLLVRRRLMSRSQPSFPIAEVELETPPEITTKNRDTVDWSVNQAVIPCRGLRMLIAVPFMFESIDMREGGGKVLFIGHSGGVASSFLSLIEMNIDITTVEEEEELEELTRDWFGYVKTDDNKLVISDYNQFIENEFNNGKRYDAVLMTACKETRNQIECPSVALMSEGFVDLLSNVVTSQGIMAINLHFTAGMDNEKKLIDLFAPKFASCNMIPYSETSRILICTQKSGWTWTDKRKTLLKNLENVDSTYEFDLSPYFIKNRI